MNERQTSRPDLQNQETVDAQQPTSPQALDLVPAKLTDVGRKRPHNEDYVEYYVPPDPQQRALKGATYLVADGMGGHQAGEVASQGAVELVIGQYYSDPDPDVGASIVRAIRAANKQIHSQAQADPSKSGMGTTLVAAVVLGRKVYVANVGDSRAYLINRTGITQITEDHSWVEEQVRAGLLTPEQARRHPQRNLVTRALGSKPSVEVDLFEGEITAGDTLLLCSDGLTGRVGDQEIAATVRENLPAEAARLLVDQANERGGNDNITVLIVRAQEEHLTMPMAAGKAPARRAKLIPILIGAAAILALVLGGLAALKFLVLDKSEATPTETPTVPASAATATPETLTAEAVAPTDSGMESPLQPELMSTLPTGTPEPTATLASTPTDAPQPTPTNASILPSLTLSPPTVSAPSVPMPTLVEPPLDLDVRGQVPFKWQYSRPLKTSEAFQVLIWPDGALEHLGAAGFTKQTEQQIDLDVLLPSRGGPGLYWWSVVVVDERTGKPISDEAAAWRINYRGAQEATEPPAATEQPQPSVPTVPAMPTSEPTWEPPPIPSPDPGE
jgi:serine/threonine protein phosphatase PrpC